MLTTRKATAKDVEFAKKIHHLAYREVVEDQFGTWDEAQQDGFFLAKWDPKTTSIIMRGSESVGCISVVEHPDHLFLSEIQIAPEFQGQGIGTQIIKEQMTEADSQDLPLRLQVLHKNERAKHLYERLGFIVCGETDRHFVLAYKR
jgi:ribosomal protein S18 acetylase RimI-like enzyme